MESLVEEFEKLKISALKKSFYLNDQICDVTIGPQSVVSSKPKTRNNIRGLKKETKEKQDNHVVVSKKIRDVPIQKSLAEIEARRKDEVQTSIQFRLEKMRTTTKQFRNIAELDYMNRHQSFMDDTRKQEDLMLQVLHEHDRKAWDHIQQLQLHYQKQTDERNRRNLEIQQWEKQRQHLATLMSNIQHQLEIFCSIYQEVVDILKSCSNIKAVAKIITNNTGIKHLPESMEKVRESYKTGRVNAGDLKLAECLVEEVKKLKQVVNQQIVYENEQEKIKELRVEPNIEVKTEIPVHIPNKQSADFEFASTESLKILSELQDFLMKYESRVAEIVNQPHLKKFKFACQKAVNIPLNAILLQNSQHLFDKYHRLSSLLFGKNVEAGGSYVCAAEHPQGIAFCTNLLAKKFVLQGDLMVSSNPESAFYFAAVLVALWVDFPDFGKLVLAHFYKEAPYLVPMYPPMIEGQTTREYYESLGFRYIDGVIEKQDKFLKRMSGIMRLYLAVMITKLKKGQHGPHPHGLKCGWRWIANILNLEPSMDITATLIHDFLEVIGSAMLATYGQQFRKILSYIMETFLPKLKKVDSGGPVTRLEVLMRKIRTTGQIEPPRGRLPDGYW